MFKAGDVIAFSGNSFISRIVQFFTRSNISHVGIVVDSGHIIEALNQGVVKTPIKELFKRSDRIYYYPLKEDLHKRFDSFEFSINIKKVLGKPYDYFQAAIAGLHESFVFFWTKEDENKYFCSELCADLLEKAGVLPEINESIVTPIDLLKLSIFESRIVLK